MIRCAFISGFVPGEAIGLAVVAALFLIMPFLGMPIGLMSAAIIALLIARRVLTGNQPAMKAPVMPITR